MIPTTARRFTVGVAMCAWITMGLLGMWEPAIQAAPAKSKATKPTGCVTCHSDSKLFVRNPKLYEYYQFWKLSAHGQEDISCVKCHGGDPKSLDADKAHGGASIAASEKNSAINFRNIPKTCAKCHKAIYEEYRQSPHFQHLQGDKDEAQGPNCVTCHGSVNTAVLRVSSVRATCATCHNEETDNSPEIPAQAELVLSKMLSVSRYYRYIGVRGEPDDVRSFFRVVDPSMERLATHWHSFDIDEVEKETRDLLTVLKLKRQEIQKARKLSKGKS